MITYPKAAPIFSESFITLIREEREAREALTTVKHVPSVRLDTIDAHGYPYRPTCSCGWAYQTRYASSAAALGLAEDHATNS